MVLIKSIDKILRNSESIAIEACLCTKFYVKKAICRRWPFLRLAAF